MDNYKKNWAICLSLVKEKLKNDRVYKTWFAPISFMGYDVKKEMLTLGVPSTYICECIEQLLLRIFAPALRESFCPNVGLRWYIDDSNSKSSKNAPVEENVRQGVNGDGRQKMYIHIPDARQRLETELRKHLGDKMLWLPAYDEVADWLADNKGRGLLCVGASGLGKSLICRTILPGIIGGAWSVCSAVEMTSNEGKISRIDVLLKDRRVVVDGLGTETVHTNYYGQRRRPFFDLCNAAEQDGKLLLITSNLSTTPDARYTDSILNRYGQDVISRLRATTSVVEFVGKDMRR